MAEELGRLLAAEGHTLICGGLGGVMEAACKGAAESGGTVVGIIILVALLAAGIGAWLGRKKSNSISE